MTQKGPIPRETKPLSAYPERMPRASALRKNRAVT